MHPLAGSDLRTFTAALRGANGLPAKNWGRIALIGACVLARQPFSWAERGVVARARAKAPPPPAPLFILGHWRSGTTHLYNIMSKAEFGFVPPVATGLPWDFILMGKLFRPLLERALPSHRYIDNIPVLPDSPQEDEIALANMTPLSFYHALYFPGNFDRLFARGLFFEGCSRQDVNDWRQTFVTLMEKLSLHQQKRMLIKNPVYTARLAMLREIAPEAKYIHINRNPYDIFVSMRNFYNKLFAQFALQPYSHVDIDKVIFETYKKMMDRFVKDAGDTPESHLIDIRYEDLEADPIGQIERIYRHLGLSGYEAARPKFENYLASVKSYQKNAFTLDDADAALIERHWGAFIEKGRYERPGASTPPHSAKVS